MGIFITIFVLFFGGCAIYFAKASRDSIGNEDWKRSINRTKTDENKKTILLSSLFFVAIIVFYLFIFWIPDEQKILALESAKNNLLNAVILIALEFWPFICTIVYSTKCYLIGCQLLDDLYYSSLIAHSLMASSFITGAVSSNVVGKGATMSAFIFIPFLGVWLVFRYSFLETRLPSFKEVFSLFKEKEKDERIIFFFKRSFWVLFGICCMWVLIPLSLFEVIPIAADRYTLVIVACTLLVISLFPYLKQTVCILIHAFKKMCEEIKRAKLEKLKKTISCVECGYKLSRLLELSGAKETKNISGQLLKKSKSLTK